MNSLARIGEIAMALADQIVKDYGDTAQVGTILVAADVIVSTDGPEWINPITFACSDPRRFVQKALIEEISAEVNKLNDERLEELEVFDFTDDED